MLTRRLFHGAVLGGVAAAIGGASSAALGRTGQVPILDFAIAGGHYHGLRAALPELREGISLDLLREPENPHDRNAIAVYRGRVRLGYIPRAVNAPLAALMDAGSRIRADIAGFVAGEAAATEGLAFTAYSSGDPRIRLFLETDLPDCTA